MIKFILKLFAGAVLFLFGATVAPLVLIPLIIRIVMKGPISNLWSKDTYHKMPEISGINPAYQHDFIKTKSGLKFHYVHTGEYGKPLLLCLHGFPECWYSWRHILDTFADRFYVVAVDLRGYGDSDKPEGISNYHLKYLTNDVNELVSAFGYEKCVLTGHDWGGVIAWETAHVFPEIIEKLIIMNAPSFRGQKYLLQKPWQVISKFWYICLFQLPFLGEFFMTNSNYHAFNIMFNGKLAGIKTKENRLTSEEIKLYKYAVGQNVTYPINFYRATNPVYYGLRPKTKAEIIKQPTLIIWGKEDHVLDAEMIPVLQQECANSQVAIIDGASHWVAQDKPKEVCAAMGTFLS